MNKITKLSWQKNGQKVNLFLDGAYVFSLQGEIVIKSNLQTGQSLLANKISQLVNQSISLELYYHSTNLIAIRPRSESEVKLRLKRQFTKLKSKYLNIKIENFEKIRIKTFVKLKKNKLINDEEFARWWVEQRLRTKPKGKIALKQELFKKGVETHIINEALADEDLISNHQTKEMIAKLLEKHWRLIANRNYDQKKAKQILTQRLMSRGFNWQDVKTQIDEFLSSQ